MSPPERSLSFLPRPSMPYSRKRGRAAADVEGEHSCMQKKKRRLRLFLITSRLSPQFSHPATNIVDRGSSRIAHWAKQKAAGRNLLPKAAILNRIRRGAVAARDAVSRRRLLVEQEKEQQQLELARLTFNYGAIHTYTRPVHSPSEPVPMGAAIRDANQHPMTVSLSGSSPESHKISRSPSPTSIPASSIDTPHYKSPNAAYALSPPRLQSSSRTYEPHLPSPLGLSNYDAFDEVSGVKTSSVDPYSHLEDDSGEEDKFSFLWNSDDDGMDDRHDSPFSPSSVEIGTTIKTPPQHACDSFPPKERRDDDISNADSDAEDANRPPPCCGNATKPARTKGTELYATRFTGFEASQLAVQYPGAPVACEEREEEVKAVARPEMVPACMSPNFLAADVGWAGEENG